MLTTAGYVVVPIFIAAFFFFIGYSVGNRNRGRLLYDTTGLPNELFMVISIDKTSAILEEVNVDRRRVFISTEVFGGKPIRPKDTVRMMGDPKKMKELGIPVLGYPPLVKTSEF